MQYNGKPFIFGIILIYSSGRFYLIFCWVLSLSFSKSGIRDDWLAAFMITGPATKITNLGALKIVLGMKRFLLYFAFIMIFSMAVGLFVNLIY